MNSLGINLAHRVILLKPTYHGGSEEERKFLCQSGYGLHPHTHGTSITGTLLVNGQTLTINAQEAIEKLWEPAQALPPPLPAEPAPDFGQLPTPEEEKFPPPGSSPLPLPPAPPEPPEPLPELPRARMAMSPQVADTLRADAGDDPQAREEVEKLIQDRPVMTREEFMAQAGIANQSLGSTEAEMDLSQTIEEAEKEQAQEPPDANEEDES